MQLTTGLDVRSSVRERAAAHYLMLAKFEHASIASFARFALALLAHGAPADLVRDANAAAIDEIEHARAAFALASAFAGEPLGPAELVEASAPLLNGIEDLVRALVEEGCVSETVGVGELLAVAEGATDPALAAHHRQIAADELRHSELAWRSLRWFLERDPSLANVLWSTFDSAIQRILGAVDDASPAPEVGLLGGAEAALARREVLRLVVEPARDALLGACVRPHGQSALEISAGGQSLDAGGEPPYFDWDIARLAVLAQLEEQQSSTAHRR